MVGVHADLRADLECCELSDGWREGGEVLRRSGVQATVLGLTKRLVERRDAAGRALEESVESLNGRA